MNNDPNRHTVLGTLVDRAVCMPYAKPQVLRHGHRRYKDNAGDWHTGASIREDTEDASAFIVHSLRSPGAHRDWSKAELALDPAGPWWSKTRDDFLGLDDEAQEWVLDHLESTADRAASCLQKEAEERGWAWLWSQPSFASPGKLRPSITRPDLIGGLDWKKCDVIDLKTTSKPELRLAVKADQEKAFESWVDSLRAMRFTPVQCHSLVVSTAADRWEWIESPAPDPDTEVY